MKKKTNKPLRMLFCWECEKPTDERCSGDCFSTIGSGVLDGKNIEDIRSKISKDCANGGPVIFRSVTRLDS